MAFSLYTTLENTVVTRDDQIEAEQLAIKVLEAAYPTLDLRSGSGLYDIVIRPTATLLAMIGKSMDQHLVDSRIDGITDDTSTDTVDSILSNFFIERKTGQKASVLVRVKFSTALPVNSVTVSPSSYFSVDNINKYIPSTTYFLTKNDNLHLYSTISESYWYADIMCESETQGTQYNIPGGTEFLYFSIFDPYFIGASCLALVEQSVETETNTEFVARAPEAISTRNLINNISIPAKLNEQFNYISNISVSGYGDYEQYRDYKEVPSTIPGRVVPFHIGGHVDVYINTPLVERVVQVTTDGAGRVIITGIDPILRITVPGESEAASSTIYGGALQTTSLLSQEDVEGYTYEDLNYTVPGYFYEKEYGYSSKQNIRIYRPGMALPANSSFDIKILQYSGISSVQTYLTDVQSRVICADYIARGYNIVDVNVLLYVEGTAPDSNTISLVKSELDKYCSNIQPGGEFTMSDVLTLTTPILSSYTVSSVGYITYTLLNGIAQQFTPTGTADYNGVISRDVVVATPGHDESSSRKVGDKFIYRINSLNIEGT